MTYVMLTSINPLVPKGTVVVESDTGRAKKGDGWTHYNDLTYLGEGGEGGGDVGGVSQGAFDALAAQVAAITGNVNAKQDAGTAATDLELTAATNTLNNSVATLSAALAAKQESSTAATDAELATAIAGVNTSISNLTTVVSSKQDTSAASSALSAAVASLNAAIALKADASSVATDAELAAGLAGVNGVGKELGYVFRDTQDTSTNTSTTDASLNGNLLAGLSIPGIVGTGTPVEVEIGIPVVVHSVLAKSVGAAVMVNGVRVHSSQVVSNSTTVGTFLIVKKRLILPNGVNHDFTVGKFGSTGTSTYYADAVSHMYLSVTQK